MADIIRLDASEYGEGHAFEPDLILEKQKGELTRVVVVGADDRGELVVSASHGSREALWLLMAAVNFLTKT